MVDKKDKAAYEKIKPYMLEHNRPHSTQSLVDNMQGAVKKVQAQRCLDHLVKEGTLTVKEWGKSKIYFSSQANYEKVEPAAIAEMDKEILELGEELAEIQKTVAEHQAKLRGLKATPTNDELSVRISALEEREKQLKASVAGLQEGREEITVEKREQVEKLYESTRMLWKKRKRMCTNAVEAIAEGMGKRRTEVFEMIGVEVDEDYKVSLEENHVAKYQRQQAQP